ncbi:MAG TPA: DoxX family protein [Dehalococcoidia bacterium]|nr:DoxX family protein [Dehalococcoidia bacterium]
MTIATFPAIARTRRRMTVPRPRRAWAPWGLQIALAALFLFAGAGKLVASSGYLADHSPFTPGFMRFIGLCEVLGAIGLTLPGALRIRPALTPVAAAGLVVIMCGATVVTALQDSVVLALGPALVGVCAALVARLRRAWLAPVR